MKAIKLKDFQKRVEKAEQVFAVTRSNVGIQVSKDEAVAFAGTYAVLGGGLMCFFKGKNLYIDCNECVAEFQVSE